MIQETKKASQDKKQVPVMKVIEFQFGDKHGNSLKRNFGINIHRSTKNPNRDNSLK